MTQEKDINPHACAAKYVHYQEGKQLQLLSYASH